jgi:hypothetical protein
MRRRRAALEPIDVELASVEVHPLPLQIGHFRCAQAVPVGHEHHERISTAVPVAPRRIDQPLNLFRPQVLSLAQVFVFRPDRRRLSYCPIFSGWRHQPEIRLCHDKSAPHDRYFPITCFESGARQGKLAAGGFEARRPMRRIGSLIEQLKRWISRYKVALNYAESKDRRRPTGEIEWNGEMIGELRRRSLDG